MAGRLTVKDLVEQFWIAPHYAEWTPKTNILPLENIREWMKSDDIEVLGFTDAMIHDGRFHIEPPMSPNEYAEFVKHYYGRCFRENPDGDWSLSAYIGGGTVVRIFISLWDDERVPRSILASLKDWLAELYKSGDDCLKTCIINATLEHLFERKPLRKYFADWQRDSELAEAYKEACLWDRKTPLSE
jgi:hypothetical protein